MASFDHTDEKGGGKNLEVHFELPKDDDHSISHQKQSSCSSSLSDSSLESVVLENNEHSVDAFESKHADNELPTLSYSSEFVYPSPVWSFQSASVIQHPLGQMMSLPGYDPNRIPLSIFSSRPKNPLAWSYTSNESLFSIQTGNCSFSNDHFFLGSKCAESSRFDEAISKRMALHPVEEAVPSDYADIEWHSDSVLSTDTSAETKYSVMVTHSESVETLAENATVVLHDTPQDNRKEGMVPREEAKNITSVSYRSEESLISAQSFQFPALAAEGGRNSLITIKTKKEEEVEKPLQPPSPKVETSPPKPRQRNRRYLFSCCSPCR